MKNTLMILFVSLLAASCSQEKKEQEASVDEVVTSGDTTSSNKYQLQAGNVYLEVDPKAGARIASLKIDDEEILYLEKNGNNNWGATFWPGPQALWGWPPPARLDSEAYADTSSEAGFSLVSKTSEKPILSFVKNFKASPEDTSVIITYTIINKGDTALKVTPWEISRVPSGGLVFFPKGKGAGTGDLKNLVEDMKGITWFDYDSTTIPAGVPKLFSDGSEGWVAYVNNNKKILIMKFEDTPFEKRAPDENEVHLYTEPNKLYTEVEHQGEYTELQPGKSLSRTVKWYVRTLPEDVKLRSGNAALVDFARNTIRK